jgi:hypothetical protein
LLLPAGALTLGFVDSIAFFEAEERTGWLPAFGLGITPALDVSLSAPLRYDVGEAGWTGLDPLVQLGVGVVRGERAEFAVRGGLLMPFSSDADTQFQLSLPALLRAADFLTVVVTPQGAVSRAGGFQGEARLPIGLTAQLASWLYTGLNVGPDLAFGETSRIGSDGDIFVGLTLQNHERAHLELLARFFVENAGAPAGDTFADGAGSVVSVTFFPSIF